MRPAQCRMARAGLSGSIVDLAGKADAVGGNSVNRFEQGQDARISSMDAMRRALRRPTSRSSQRTAVVQAVRLSQVNDTGAIKNRIDELHAEADALDTSGTPASQKALNTKNQAVARNAAAKRKGKPERPNKL